jgi:hypothetical protein
MSAFILKIKEDLKDSQITWTVVLAFIPIAFFTFLFHEFGHYLFGEIMGTKMMIGLNVSAPQSGHFEEASHALVSAIGGPVFTIFQALIFTLVLVFYQSVYAYSLVYFAFFIRFYSIVFGGFKYQDESRIGDMLNIPAVLVAALVIGILILILWRATKLMKMDLKAVGYYFVLSVAAVLVVIGVDGNY